MGAKKLLNILFVTLLSVTLISCGESDEEKLEKKANALVEEFNSLADDLNYRSPNAMWSAEDLEDYTTKLDRFESVYNELMNLEAENDELYVYGGYNTTEFISNKRVQLTRAWSQRNKEERIRKERLDREVRERLAEANKADKVLEISENRSNLLDLTNAVSDFISNNDYEPAENKESIIALEEEISKLNEFKSKISKLDQKVKLNADEHFGIGELDIDELLERSESTLDLIESSIRLKKAQIMQITLAMN